MLAVKIFVGLVTLMYAFAVTATVRKGEIGKESTTTDKGVFIIQVILTFWGTYVYLRYL
jgi:hypothetical protein